MAQGNIGDTFNGVPPTHNVSQYYDVHLEVTINNANYLLVTLHALHQLMIFADEFIHNGNHPPNIHRFVDFASSLLHKPSTSLAQPPRPPSALERIVVAAREDLADESQWVDWELQAVTEGINETHLARISIATLIRDIHDGNTL